MKRIIGIITCLLMLFMLVGCSYEMPTFALSGIDDALAVRKEQNLQILKEMYDAGLLDADSYTDLQKTIGEDIDNLIKSYKDSPDLSKTGAALESGANQLVDSTGVNDVLDSLDIVSNTKERAEKSAELTSDVIVILGNKNLSVDEKLTRIMDKVAEQAESNFKSNAVVSDITTEIQLIQNQSTEVAGIINDESMSDTQKAAAILKIFTSKGLLGYLSDLGEAVESDLEAISISTSVYGMGNVLVLGESISDWALVKPLMDVRGEKNSDGETVYSYTVQTYGYNIVSNHIYYALCAGFDANKVGELVDTKMGTNYKLRSAANEAATNEVLALENAYKSVSEKNLERIQKLVPLFKGSGSITPIQIVAPPTPEEMRNGSHWTSRFGCKLYVLKDGVDIAQATRRIEEAKEASFSGALGTEKRLHEVYSMLEDIFEPLLDENNNPVTLVDMLDKENQLIKLSEGHSSIAQIDSTGKIIKGLDINRWGSPNTISTAYNYPGHDLVVTQQGQGVLSLKVYDFNRDAWERIKESLKLSDSTYWVQGDRAYLMQYDVGFVEGYSVDLEENTYTAEIIQSDIFVNLLTKKVGKVISDEAANEQYIVASDKDMYIYLDGDSFNFSSFVVYGETGWDETLQDRTAWNLTFGAPSESSPTPSGASNGGRVKASIPRIVLRDYLELAYTPDVIEGESLVAYGRMIRLGKETENGWSFDGSLSDPRIGEYVRFMSGDCDTYTGQMVYISDLADIYAIQGLRNEASNTPYIEKLPAESNMMLTSEEDIEALYEEYTTIVTSDRDTEPKVQELDQITVSKITMTTEFSGWFVGKSDYIKGIDYSIKVGNNAAATTCPKFYGIAVNNVGQELINYITSDADYNSTNWWNSWLKDHKFKYSIPDSASIGFFKENYSFELGKSGVVILEFETLAKIQKDFDEMNNSKLYRAIRTGFMIFGHILTVYSTLLLVAWAIDTNFDLGFQWLSILTFGHMVAVTDCSEVPNVQGDKICYTDMRRLIVVCIVICSLGVFFRLVDIMDFIYKLILMFEGFAKFISKPFR